MYDKWRVPALQEELRHRGLEARGKKDELIARLEADDEVQRAQEQVERKSEMNKWKGLWTVLVVVTFIAMLAGAFLWAPQLVAAREPAAVPKVDLSSVEEELADLGEQFQAGFDRVVTVLEKAREPAAPATPQVAQPVDSWAVGSWHIQEYDLADNPIVEAWLRELRDPAPKLWPTYPNVPNPKVAFDVANGVEYGPDNAPFCQQDERCDLIVPAWHYRLVTGDYQFENWSCQGDAGRGCLLLLINVMDQSFTWRDQRVDNGFTVTGRYWNGDELDWAVWGLVSHASANMLGMPTMRNPNTGDVLNAGIPGNAGSNCGTPNACGKINARVVIHAGDRILAVAETTVSR